LRELLEEARPGVKALTFPRYAANACVGGFGLAERFVEYCGFTPGSRLADIGCGDCATANRLAAKYGLYFSCVDISSGAAPEVYGDKVSFLNARAEALPFAGAAFDGVMFECSASLTDDPGAAFREARRVLFPGGYLAVSDFYASGELGLWLEIISGAGFEILSVDECTRAVSEFWGQMILDRGAEEACREFGFDVKARSRERLRYFMAVARGKGSL
jgi:SAM-dependent methyltransferase